MEPDRAKLRLIRTGAKADRPPTAPAYSDPPPYFPDHADSAMPVRLDSVRLLSQDAHGRVLDWMSWQDATCLYARGAVAWTLGDPCLTVHGGICRVTGERSSMELHPIIAAR